MAKKGSAYSTALIFAILSFWANSGYAYFHASSHAKGISLSEETRHAGQDKNDGAFVLYDNSNTISRQGVTQSIFHRRSRNFVPAEVINCNIPIRITVHDPVTPKNALANLLYGDLRLKKLFEEKKALRQRSIEILAGLSVPFIEHIMPSYRLASAGLSVHQETEKLQRNYQAVKNSIQLSTFRSYKVAPLTLSSPDSWATLDMTQRRAERMRAASVKSVVGEKRQLTNGTRPSQEDENNGTVQSNMPRQQDKKSLNHNNRGVPWIFRIFIKLQELLFSSPREVIISLLVVAFFVSLLFSGKRR